MFKTKIKNKETGETTICNVRLNKNGERCYYSIEDENVVYDKNLYDEIQFTPYELFGIECLDGWKELYEPVIAYVNEYNKDKNEKDKLIIHQIKEKWGKLDFHFNFYTEELMKLVNNARNESGKVCEKCGSRDNVGMTISGWHQTICLECLKKERDIDGIDVWMRNDDSKIYIVRPNGDMEVAENKK